MKRTHGFTLVELLVVIAIIGILIALLLPAVQSAREAARRSQCTNNLKQLALAAHNHHDTYGGFPEGVSSPLVNDPGHINRSSWTWAANSLPFNEQQALYDSLGVSDGNASEQFLGAADRAAYAALLGTVLPGLTCPSDVGETHLKDVSDWVVNGFTYYNSWHRIRNDLNGGKVFTAKSNYAANQGPSDPVGTTHWPLGGRTQKARGAIVSFNKTRMAEITDGTSNTFLFGERMYHFDAKIGAAASLVVGYGNTGASHRAAYFMPKWPPNAIPTSGIWGYMAGTSSYHPGGANFALCDGSVRFVSDTIWSNVGGVNDGQFREHNTGTYQRLCLRDDGLVIGNR